MKKKRVLKKWIRTKADERAIKEGCWFDDDAGQHVCDFIETYCVYTKGGLDVVGQPVELLDWQRDFLMRLFGWKTRSGRRRFRAASVWLPKKNGKTTLCAWIVLYLLVADGEIAAEVYSAANSRSQAMKIWSECHAIIKRSPELEQLLEGFKSTSRITFEATQSFYEAIPCKPDSVEGLNASGVVIDEIHRFDKPRSADFFNALRWAGKARHNPLFVTISTAGIFDPTTTSWRQYKLASDIVNGISTQTDLLAIIYEMDKEADWHTSNPKCEEVWKQSNPSLGVTMDVENFRHDVEAAEQSPSGIAPFLRYNFNVWQSASSAWITHDRLMTCFGDTNLTQEQIDKMTWYAGLDLASRIDINALALFGIDEETGKKYVKCFYWVSQDQASARQKNDQVNYEFWSKPSPTGEWKVPPITATPGEDTDWGIVRRDVLEICKKYSVKRLGIDQFKANATAQQLQGDGLPVDFYPQGFREMSPPIKEIERMVYTKELVWDCPVFSWMMSNVEIIHDDFANVRISRKRSREKVDICIALAQAVGLSMSSPKVSMYQKRAEARAKEKEAAEHT